MHTAYGNMVSARLTGKHDVFCYLEKPSTLHDLIKSGGSLDLGIFRILAMDNCLVLTWGEYHIYLNLKCEGRYTAWKIIKLVS
jgi:hypothetical protein